MSYHYRGKLGGPILWSSVQTLLSTGLARVEIFVKLSLQSKLGNPLRQSSKESVSKINDVRVKVIVISEVSLFSKIRTITALKLGREAMAGDDPKGCQRKESNLHVRGPLEFLQKATPQGHGWGSRLLTDTVVGAYGYAQSYSCLVTRELTHQGTR